MRTDAGGCVLAWSCGRQGPGSALQRERRQRAVRVELLGRMLAAGPRGGRDGWSGVSRERRGDTDAVLVD